MTKSKRLFTILGIILLAFVTGVVAVNYIFLPIIIRIGSEMETPSLLGVRLYDARETLRDHNLALIVIAEQYSADYQIGCVIFQSPDAGTRIKKNQTVEVIVSRGPEDRMLPDLTNNTYRQAELILSRLGLQFGNISYVHNDFIPDDRVIAQNPQHNSKVKVGSNIDLLISKDKWPENYLMPKLVGNNLDQVRFALIRFGMGVSDVEYIYDQNLTPGAVIEQYPFPGAIISRNIDIRLKIVKGMTYGQTPDSLIDTTSNSPTPEEQ
jgi:eukaryotic-like serine/threonine-protein kinase